MTDGDPPRDTGNEPGLSSQILAWADQAVAAVSADRVFQHCSVFVADDRRGELVLAGQLWGTGEDTGAVVPGQWVVPFEGSVCGTVYLTGRSALIEDVTSDTWYRPYPGAEPGSELAVAILSGGRRIGVINLESPRTGTFGIADLDRLTGHAERAGSAFEKAGLASELES
jgi:putative methionine-R-sulfoxide reductase with GAF domain